MNLLPLRRATVLASLCASISIQDCIADPAACDRGRGRECVVLLHGWGRSSFSMRPVKRALELHGYTVVSLSYPTWRVPIEQLADVYLANELDERVPEDALRIHFVTHSFGGILLRQYLSNHHEDRLGRVVMLAPPNQGCEVANLFHRFAIVRWLAGPNLSRLGTHSDSLPRRLDPVTFETGIIAGTRPFLGIFLRADSVSDGIVSVEETRVQGMKDWIAIERTHTFLMRSRESLDQTASFLNDGWFRHHSSRQNVLPDFRGHWSTPNTLPIKRPEPVPTTITTRNSHEIAP